MPKRYFEFRCDLSKYFPSVLSGLVLSALLDRRRESGRMVIVKKKGLVNNVIINY